jgi:F-type H+-transporting ATPase subunit epsilon
VLHVELVSPERILFEGEAEMVVCRTTEGEIAFLTGHAPFLGALGVATVRVISPGSVVVAAVHGGFVEVRDDRVIILSDVAELPDQIDLERARSARQRAEELLRADEADADALAALARATVRLELAAGPV